LSTPASKRKKISKAFISDSSSSSSDEDDTAKNSAKKLPTAEQAAVWKIDRLKASLQKPASEPKDNKPTVAEPIVQKEAKDDFKKNAVNEEQPKESKEKVRKEDTKPAKEKLDKRASLTEAASRTPIHGEDRSVKDASGKSFKHNEQVSSKPLEKGSKTDAKLRQSYVIPKVKKTAPASSPVVADTWSDMMKRGAELEKNRYKQVPSNSSGIRRIPKIPKVGLCDRADVGVLDKIEQHPGFLRWQQAASQKNTSKTEDERDSVAAKSKDIKPSKSKDNTSQKQLPSTAASTIATVQQTSTPVSNKRPEPLPLMQLTPEPPQPPPVTPSPVLSETSTKSVKPLLPVPAKAHMTSLLGTPPSTKKKALLPTPASKSLGATPIPVLVRRGTAPPSRSQLISSPTGNEDSFVPEESASHPG